MIPNTELELAIKQEILKITQYNTRLSVGFPNLTVEVINDVAGELVAQITKHVCGRDRWFTFDLEPAGVWQHFKRDWTPQWFQKLFPVVMMQRTMFASELFPHRHLSDRELGQGYIIVHSIEEVGNGLP